MSLINKIAEKFKNIFVSYTNPIYLTNRAANIDSTYGPYELPAGVDTPTLDMLDNNAKDTLYPGKTFGIIKDGQVVEYWAQLKDSVIDGVLKVTNNVTLQTVDKGIQGINPLTGNAERMIQMSGNGDTLIGYDGYKNKSGNSHVCGNDIKHFVAAAGDDVSYRPYYRAGDTIDIVFKSSGFVTASGTAVAFTIPLTKPIIGNPTAEVLSMSTFVLRQNGDYTHGSNGGASPVVNAKPKSYSIESNYNSGIVMTAIFDSSSGAGSVENNSYIGVAWSGKITLY